MVLRPAVEERPFSVSYASGAFTWSHPGRIQVFDLLGRKVADLEAGPELIGQQKLKADAIHRFDSVNAIGPVTHVRLNIFPDGGISRLRLFGKLAE